MKCVLDTSVLISAIKGDSDSAFIINLFRSGSAIWLVSKDILYEYRQIIERKKFSFNEDTKKLWYDIIENHTQKIDNAGYVKFSRDPSDSRFISLAESSEADYLFTFDRAILAASYKIKSIICTPKEFAENTIQVK